MSADPISAGGQRTGAALTSKMLKKATTLVPRSRWKNWKSQNHPSRCCGQRQPNCCVRRRSNAARAAGRYCAETELNSRYA